MGNAGIATEFLRMCARGEVGEACGRHDATDFVHSRRLAASNR